MFKCKRCDEEFRDGAQCSACQGHFDFACAGITETGYRRLGDNRKSVWKCVACKSLRPESPLPPKTPVSPTSLELESVLTELRRLSLQVAILPRLEESIKAIKTEMSELKSIKPELSDIKLSIEFVDNKMTALSDRISTMEKDISALNKTKTDVVNLQQKICWLEGLIMEGEQRSRMNNLEIKGVPTTNNENLFDVIARIGNKIKVPIPKEQINYIVRAPMRNDSSNKTIIVAVHSRYFKDDFISAARKCTLTPQDLGLQGVQRIYINDHLTAQNKILLNKTKEVAKDRGFAYIWVRGCKIFARRNPTSPVIAIRSETDLKKF